MTRYTVFEDDGEEFVQPEHRGLSLQGAFQWIMGHCGFDYRFERRGSDYLLTAWDLNNPEAEPHELVSPLANILDAKRELMERAIDGRFKAHIALPDAEFQQRLIIARRIMDGEARRQESR